MKKATLTAMLVLSILGIGIQGHAKVPEQHSNLYFIANQGQWPDQVHFLAKTRGVNVWITTGGIIYDYYRFTGTSAEGRVNGQVVAMSFGQSVSPVQFKSHYRSGCYFNYFTGMQPAGWATRVPAYQSVSIQNIYPGIDMELSLDRGQVRYDFIVRPGADPQQIKLTFSGANKISVLHNNLVLTTSIGDRIQGELHAVQNGQSVACQMIMTGENTAGFHITSYNPTQMLRIDPLVFSTYLGGNSEEQAMDIAVDENDQIYLGGYTWSTDFPTTNGAYQHDLKGASDAFISCFTANGNELLFTTFLGGSLQDVAYAMVYKDEKIFLTGTTFSDDFPVTGGAFQDENKLGGDLFIASMSADGSTLNFSTYVGGLGNDIPLDLEAGQSLLIGGRTTSSDFPVTGDAYDATYDAGGLADGFIIKMSLNGAMEYASYLGSTGEDQVTGVAWDPTSSSTFYLTGQTTSADFPVSADAMDNVLGADGSNNQDAFVMKFTNNQLNYSTFLGGTSTDYANSVIIGSNHRIMIAGTTWSTDFPTTADALRKSREGIYQDAYVTILLPDGIAGTQDLLYGTYLGGYDEDEATDLYLDSNNHLYVTGYTHSPDFHVTGDAVSTEAIGNKDVFLIRFNITNHNLEYATFLGGSFDDKGLGLAQKSNGEILVTGYTYSFNYPVTDQAYDKTYNSENYPDAFLSSVSINASGIDESGRTGVNRLLQNSPNPFSQFTWIPYQLGQSGNVTLYVRDLTGKVLFTRKITGQPIGIHQIKISTGQIPPGIYLYTLQTARWIETRRMVVY